MRSYGFSDPDVPFAIINASEEAYFNPRAVACSHSGMKDDSFLGGIFRSGVMPTLIRSNSNSANTLCETGRRRCYEVLHGDLSDRSFDLEGHAMAPHYPVLFRDLQLRQYRRRRRSGRHQPVSLKADVVGIRDSDHSAIRPVRVSPRNAQLTQGLSLPRLYILCSIMDGQLRSLAGSAQPSSIISRTRGLVHLQIADGASVAPATCPIGQPSEVPHGDSRTGPDLGRRSSRADV
jgi:hypothetical protein